MAAPTPPSRVFWILRDLSNGDGAGGGSWPTYIWAYATRKQARERGQLHRKKGGMWARLGPVECRDAREITKRYTFNPNSPYAKRMKGTR